MQELTQAMVKILEGELRITQRLKQHLEEQCKRDIIGFTLLLVLLVLMFYPF